MKHQTIHTKYHKLEGAFCTLGLGGKTLPVENMVDQSMFNRLLNEMKQIPHYVLEPDIMNMISDPNSAMVKSLVTMIENDLARLPFKEILVEYDEEIDITIDEEEMKATARHFVFLAESKDQDEKFNAMTWVFLDHRLIVPSIAISPFVAGCDLITTKQVAERRNQIKIMNPDALGDRPCGAVFRAVPAPYMKVNPISAQRWLDNPKILDYAMAPAVKALSAIIVLLRTRGVVQDKIEVSPKLNKARQSSGKSIILDHTVIRVGYTYSRDGTRVEYNKTGRRMPVHWRAGHWRHQAHGPSRSLRKDIFIEPMLINYVEGDTPVPKPKEIHSATPLLPAQNA